MPIKLNDSGRGYARSLMAGGKVDKTSAWSFSAEDGDALLGPKGDDWANYAKHHLGVDTSSPDKTKARWKYPFGKGEKLYRSALAAIRQRAGQQNDTDIFAAAGEMLKEIDGASATSRIEGRCTPFEFKFIDQSGAPAGSFEGYGSVFDNRDDYGDVIRQGAFANTLAQAKSAGRMPKMLLNHGGLPWGGQTAESLLPVGAWDHLAEDSRGLEAKGRLINLETESGKRLYGAMKERQIDGLSMTYVAREFKRGTKPSDPRRSITAVDLLEMGPVTFPANGLATISEVKSNIHDIRFLETALRDAGLSRSEAKALLAGGFKAIALRDAEVGELAALQALAESIRSLT